MSSMTKIIGSIIIGIILGALAMNMLQVSDSIESLQSTERKPLYWVAPMDDNYRRDQPGKSPMGMDLVPVYEESSSGKNAAPGTVQIAPNVVNNLGVRTADVALESLQTTISTVGYVQYNEDTMIHIHPRVNGWVEKLYVKAIGDPVKKDEPLYTLYSPELVNAQDELLLTLKGNNKELVEASKERLRQLQLSPAFIDNLMRTKKTQQTVTFYSPQSGVIDELKIREGFYVEPGTTLFSIGQLDNVWVEAEVFERDTALVKSGLPVSMKLDYLPGKVWEGSVDYVYPTLNTKTRTLRVRLTFDNPDRQLKPSMYAQVDIHADQADPTITVPKESVIRTGNQDRVVLALGEGQFKSVAVTVGRVDRNRIEILDGLNEDDVIVTSAHFLIDSESSKSSDFKRMSNEAVPDSVWVEGKINEVMLDMNMVNITHEPMDAWNMPGMTMNFEVTDKVDIKQLKAGQTLHFEAIKLTSGMYAVNGIHIMSESDPSETMREEVTLPDGLTDPAWVQGKINTIMLDARLLSVSHGPIEDWGMQGMTMFFTVAKGLDMSTLKQGQSLYFKAYKMAAGYMITEIHNEPVNDQLMDQSSEDDAMHKHH